jgi:hypothetical protein
METARQSFGLPGLETGSPAETLGDRILLKEKELVNHSVIVKLYREKRDRAGGWDKDANGDYENVRAHQDTLLGEWVELQTQL